jgi:hypothetical protein
VTRLENLAQPHIKWRRQVEEEWHRIRAHAAQHAAVLAFLIRYGNPIIDEPLSCAWQRCAESSAWEECCDRFREELPTFERSRTDRPVDPFKSKYVFKPDSRDSTMLMGEPLRHMVIANFSGADEKEKLNATFASAPPWLVWFTFGDYTAKLLGLTIPDLSSVLGFARSKANFDLWYGFPSGAFERRPWPNGPDGEPLARTDLNLLRPEMERPVSQMSPRERKRAARMGSVTVKRPNEWPDSLRQSGLRCHSWINGSPLGFGLPRWGVRRPARRVWKRRSGP